MTVVELTGASVDAIVALVRRNPIALSTRAVPLLMVVTTPPRKTEGVSEGSSGEVVAASEKTTVAFSTNTCESAPQDSTHTFVI
jgi:hypothetical protein